jgi:hypothetical protein
MSTEKAALRVTELDFDTIRENLKTYLRAQSEFQDFDFEGSGMAVLLDILAYNTHYMAYHLNMVGNEMFIDTAQIRESVISHAKLMNYVPASPQGALTQVHVKVTPSNAEDQAQSTLVLEKYTRLLGTDKDGVNYPFVTLYSNTATKTSNYFEFANVNIKQGEVVSLQYQVTSDTEARRYEIPSSNVDTTTISIVVQDSSSNSDIQVYSLADDITELNANSKVYFIEENENQRYTFYFGDNVIGKRPRNGNIVTCTYLDTVGSVSNNINKFVLTGEIANKFSDNVVITSTRSSYGGSDKETIENVRFRSPYFYSTQNRAVTKPDYENLLIKDYNYIDALSVWGGEENDPVVYGKVFMSIKTKGNFQLTNFEKEKIKRDLIQSRNVLTVTPEVVDPDYVFINVRGTATYDQSKTSLSAGELEQYVRAAVQDYNDQELNNFKTVFRKSKLSYYIENAEPAITGSDFVVFVQKRVLIDINNIKSYTINFGFPIKTSFHEHDAITTYPSVQVFDASGIPRNVFFEQVPAISTGIDKIQIITPGKNYFSAPTITISGDGSGATARAKVRGGIVEEIEVTNPGKDYTFATVNIVGTEGTGATAQAILQINQGSLRTFYYKSGDSEKVIVNPSAGTIDYNNGKIVITSLRAVEVEENQFFANNYMTITVPVENDIIYTERERILLFDENDPKAIKIEAVTE